jgi:hypothetical protein
MKKIIGAVLVAGAMSQFANAMGPMGDTTHRRFYKDQEWIWQKTLGEEKAELSGAPVTKSAIQIWTVPVVSTLPLRPPLASTLPLRPPLASTLPLRPPLASTLPLRPPLASTLPLRPPLASTLPLRPPLASTLPLRQPAAS